MRQLAGLGVDVEGPDGSHDHSCCRPSYIELAQLDTETASVQQRLARYSRRMREERHLLDSRGMAARRRLESVQGWDTGGLAGRWTSAVSNSDGGIATPRVNSTLKSVPGGDLAAADEIWGRHTMECAELVSRHRAACANDIQLALKQLRSRERIQRPAEGLSWRAERHSDEAKENASTSSAVCGIPADHSLENPSTGGGDSSMP